MQTYAAKDDTHYQVKAFAALLGTSVRDFVDQAIKERIEKMRTNMRVYGQRQRRRTR